MYIVPFKICIAIVVFRLVAPISSGRFYLVKSCDFTAIRLFGAGVIGMQVRHVARKPLECFVNGQLCLSTEPISHSKVWHHVKLPPNHSCVMCFEKGPVQHTYLGA